MRAPRTHGAMLQLEGRREGETYDDDDDDDDDDDEGVGG